MIEIGSDLRVPLTFSNTKTPKIKVIYFIKWNWKLYSPYYNLKQSSPFSNYQYINLNTVTQSLIAAGIKRSSFNDTKGHNNCAGKT